MARTRLAVHQHARRQARGEFASRLSAQRLGVGGSPVGSNGEAFGPVGPQNLAPEQEPTVLDSSMAGDWRAAGAFQLGEVRAFGGEGPSGLGMGDGAERIERCAVPSPGGQRDRSLAGGGKESLEVERPPSPVNETEPL